MLIVLSIEIQCRSIKTSRSSVILKWASKTEVFYHFLKKINAEILASSACYRWLPEAASSFTSGQRKDGYIYEGFVWSDKIIRLYRMATVKHGVKLKGGCLTALFKTDGWFFHARWWLTA